MAEKLLINELLGSFKAREQQTILQEAGLEAVRERELSTELRLLIPPILRRIKVSNDQFRQLMRKRA
jgi:hypothetical protein